MSENDHPKVIVDDDFLDLRNPQTKTFSRRPTSSRSKTKDSSSTNTQGKAGTPREVLPGLQKLLNTYNQKNLSIFRSKRGNDEKNVQIDSRFRRKIEKKALSTRSASILQERGKLVKEQNGRSNSSEGTESTVSSTSEKKSEIMLEKQPSRSFEKPSARPAKNEPTEVKIEVNAQDSRSHEIETSNFKTKIEDEIRSSREKKKFKDEEDPSAGIQKSNGRNEKLLQKSSTPVKKENDKFENLPTAEKYNDGEYRTASAEGSSSAARRKKDKFEKLLDQEKCKNEELFNIEETSSRDKYTKPNSREAMKDLVQQCSVISNTLQQLKWYDPSLLLPHSLDSIPSVRRSWTIPSFPQINREVFWGRHYNALCEKEDRKTYKFDADDTISLESLNKTSSQPSRFRSNYMNLIFCLGCMCGIFLVAGILTASEIQANIYKPDESKLAFFELIFKEILYTFEVIFDGFLQVLTFPRTFFKPKETPKSWVLF